MRKQLLHGALLFSSLLAGFSGRAQQEPRTCGSQAELQRLHAGHPELDEAYRQLLANNVHVTEEDGKKRIIYRIPVVFHILHEYGPENISDAQIYDQMDILNEDFRKLNTDITQVVPEFQGIAADCQIEFQLATIDPYGNCTNGIEHIYSHETWIGDDFSKLHQWYRDRYLNVWVSDYIKDGHGGYSYPPSSVEGNNFYIDGVIIRHAQTGSIGTSSATGSRSLTHEIGHWLGLAHTWGWTNDPEISCGDDGIADTPITKGHTVCNLTDATCTPGVVENVQNYMEYAFCSNMYTNGQSNFMHNVLVGEVSQRNNLWTPENHTATGIDVLPPPTCIPVADFSVNHRMICAGDAVTFKDASWRAGITTRQWSFPGGTPATSTVASPQVTYDQPGYYTAKLVVSNAAGTDSLVQENMVYVSGTWSEFTGPVVEDFEGPSAGWWIVQNPENNYARFQKTGHAGKDLSDCYALKSYRDLSQALPFTDEAFYDDRLGHAQDNLISPAFNLSNTSNVSVSFDYAYGTKAVTTADITEVLKVYSSRDCGKTWILRETVSGADLLTIGYVGNSDFSPVNNTQWKNASFTYTTTPGDTRTRFKFEFTASDKSNNLYLDNINVSGTMGIAEPDEAAALVSIAPNPVQAGNTIDVQVGSMTPNLTLELLDVNGARIALIPVAPTNGTQTVQIAAPVAKGCYFLNAISGTVKSTHRVIVY